VHRWALERWAPDPYPVVVFHRGPLPSPAQAALDRLKNDAPGCNLAVREVDVAAPMDDETRAVWETQSAPELPWVVVRHPVEVPPNVQIWAGPLTGETVEAVVNSPKRREAAQHLLKGDTIVWVLLDGDDAAAEALDAALEDVRKNPPEPELTPGGEVSGRVFPFPRFPVLNVSRTDPAESVFVEMLLGVERDLRSYEEPMAFPLFGRGRALYALVGAGINTRTVRKACAFLVNGCSCQVKEQNPGMDLLLAANWDEVIGDVAAAAAADLPPLPGVPRQPEPQAQPPSNALLRNLLVAVAAGALLVAAASLALWKRRDSSLHG